MTRGKKLARRAFLVGAGTLGGGLLVGAGAVAARLRSVEGYTLPSPPGATSFGAWLSIAGDGRVEVVVPHQDMGQGIYALATLLAAEGLKVPPDSVHAVPAPVAAHYANPVMLLDGLPLDPAGRGPLKGATLWTFDKILRVLGVQGTGGSTSTRNIAEPIRACAATTLDLLQRAAGQRLGVAPELLRADNGALVAPDGRRLPYGDVAAAAAGLTPREIALPALGPGLYTGRGIARPDVPAKTRGVARYGIDTREAGQLYAAIRHAPRLGGAPADARLPAGSPARGLVRGRDYVAVVADRYATALAALDAAEITWADAGLSVSSADVFAAYRAALDRGQKHTPRWVVDSAGDVSTPAPDAKTLRATYQVPFLAHTTMEPMNATALVTEHACSVWAGHQSATLVQQIASSAAGVPSDAVTVHTPWLGGGFGRRADLDVVRKAVEVATHFRGTPVQLIWTREEDIRNDMYRPAAMADVSATLDSGGLPATFVYRVAVPSITDQYVARLYPSAKGGLMADKTTVDGAVFPLYALPNRSIENFAVDLGVPVGFWRSVGYSINCFCVESFVDELAAAAGLRPLDFRARLLGLEAGDDGRENSKRAGRIVQRLARFDAQTPLPAARDATRTGRGFALTEAFHSILGHAADVEITGTDIRVTRVFVVADCGFAIDPPNVIAQVRSGVNYGLSAALFGNVEIDRGTVVPTNFDSYPALTLANAPSIDVEIINSGAAISGVGEIGTPGIAPAVANAIFAATGERLRTLPFALTGA